MTEAELQAAIIETAETFGWLWHHETDSRRSHAGFPDLVLAKAPRLAMLELKAERGRIRPEQQRWVDELALCDTFTSAVVRPGDLDRVIRYLRGPA